MPLVPNRQDVPVTVDASLCIEGCTLCIDVCPLDSLALDPETGKLAWHFQHVTPEVWDLDWVYEQSLVTVPVKGKPTKLVVTGGKIALFDGVDRSNGKYALSVDAGLQTLITKVDPVTGAKERWP